MVTIRGELASIVFFFFFQAEDGIRDYKVTGVQTCALPILSSGVVNLSALMTGRRLGIGDPYGVAVGIPRLDAMTVNAASRVGDPRGGPSAAESRGEIRAFESQWASAESPPEWRIWGRHFAPARGPVRGGMRGGAATGFF